jgi:hypothetical protein
MTAPMHFWFNFPAADEVFVGMQNRIPEGCAQELRLVAIDQIKYYFITEVCAYLGFDLKLDRPSITDKFGNPWYYDLDARGFVVDTGGGVIPSGHQRFEKATGEAGGQ